jgi:hypothetical protein
MEGDDSENGDRGSEPGATDGSDPSRPVPAVALEHDDVFEALANARRRFLFRELAAVDPVSLDDTARSIAAWENDVPEETVRESERRSVFLSLYHVHVPRLVADGLVTFEEDDLAVSLDARGETALDVLAAAGGALDAEGACLNGS